MQFLTMQKEIDCTHKYFLMHFMTKGQAYVLRKDFLAQYNGFLQVHCQSINRNQYRIVFRTLLFYGNMGCRVFKTEIEKYSSVLNRRACTFIIFQKQIPSCMALFGSACFQKKIPLHIYSILHVYWYIIIFDKIKWMHYGCIKGCLLTYLQSVTKIGETFSPRHGSLFQFDPLFPQKQLIVLSLNALYLFSPRSSSFRMVRTITRYITRLGQVRLGQVGLGAIRKLRKHLGVLSWSSKCLFH